MSGTLQTTERCRSCRAQIAWAITPNGKKLPLDPEPHDQGNLTVSLDGGVLRTGVVLRAAREAMHEAGNQLYLSHFATCAHADQWRKR